jgi:hypothetical protein
MRGETLRELWVQVDFTITILLTNAFFIITKKKKKKKKKKKQQQQRMHKVIKLSFRGLS